MALNSAEPRLKRLKTATLIRHFRPVKKRAKAKKALTRLRTIANKLIRGDTHFKNKIKTFNAYTLPKVHQFGSITRHTWHIV
jgi:hypothetical protein